jgi:hypothetical protein
MSLASRVANLFSSGSTDAPREGNNSLGFDNDGLPGGKETFIDVRLGVELARPENMAPKALEDGRPPYLHVSYFSSFEKQILMSLVHDRRRAWRYHGGSFDALFGHGEDPPTGRPSHPAKIHGNVIILFYNSSARGHKARAIRWLAPCYAWIFPGHYHILWNL